MEITLQQYLKYSDKFLIYAKPIVRQTIIQERNYIIKEVKRGRIAFDVLGNKIISDTRIEIKKSNRIWKKLYLKK